MSVEPPLHRRLKLRQLEVLEALGRHASLHRAARELGMTQPAASKLLQEVEGLIGARLFERTIRGVVPTPAGSAMVARARRAIGVIDGAREELAAIGAGSTGLLRVGASAVASAFLVPRAVALLRERGLALRIRVEEADVEAMLASLRAGALDCVVGRAIDGAAADGLVLEPLYDQPPSVVARPGHPLAAGVRSRAGWKAACGHEWVLPPPSAPLRRAFVAWLARKGLPEPRCTLETVSILATVAMLRDTDCLALLPGVVATSHARLGLLRTVGLRFDATRPPVSLLRRDGETPGAALEAFSAALHTVGQGVRADRGV
jgi:DNA-binding transcriptional LysR family regulator